MFFTKFQGAGGRSQSRDGGVWSVSSFHLPASRYLSVFFVLFVFEQSSQLDCENLFLRQEIEKSLRVVKPTLNKYLRRLVINCLLVWKTTELRWTQQLQAYCLVGAKIL